MLGVEEVTGSGRSICHSVLYVLLNVALPWPLYSRGECRLSRALRTPCRDLVCGRNMPKPELPVLVLKPPPGTEKFYSV